MDFCDCLCSLIGFLWCLELRSQGEKTELKDIGESEGERGDSGFEELPVDPQALCWMLNADIRALEKSRKKQAMLRSEKKFCATPHLRWTGLTSGGFFCDFCWMTRSRRPLAVRSACGVLDAGCDER